MALGATAAAKLDSSAALRPEINDGADSPVVTTDSGLSPGALAQSCFPLFAFDPQEITPPQERTGETISAAGPPQTTPAATQPAATQPGARPEPRTATEVVTAAIIDKAAVAVVRRSSEAEAAAALRRFAQGNGVSAAGKYFIVEQCLQVLTVEQAMRGLDPAVKTICVISACGGAGFTRDTRAGPMPRTPGSKPGSDEPQIRIYASFTDSDAEWVAFLLPLTAESLDERGKAHLEEMQKAGLPIGDLYRLHSRRGGLKLASDPEGKDPAVVPPEFVGDLKILLSDPEKEAGELKTPLGRRVQERIAAQSPAGKP